MNLSITEKDLRELLIFRAARINDFKRACRIRAKYPNQMPLSRLSSLRSLIDEVEEKITEFQQNYLL